MSKRTAYQHFGSKDEFVAEYLRRLDPDTMPEVVLTEAGIASRHSDRICASKGDFARASASVEANACRFAASTSAGSAENPSRGGR